VFSSVLFDVSVYPPLIVEFFKNHHVYIEIPDFEVNTWHFPNDGTKFPLFAEECNMVRHTIDFMYIASKHTSRLCGACSGSPQLALSELNLPPYLRIAIGYLYTQHLLLYRFQEYGSTERNEANEESI